MADGSGFIGMVVLLAFGCIRLNLFCYQVRKLSGCKVIRLLKRNCFQVDLPEPGEIVQTWSYIFKIVLLSCSWRKLWCPIHHFVQLN